MLYYTLIYVVAGLVLMGLIALLWYLQPRKLPSNPETDGDLRPSSDRIRQDMSLYRLTMSVFGRRGMPAPKPMEDATEMERQAQLGRFESDE